MVGDRVVDLDLCIELEELVVGEGRGSGVDLDPLVERLLANPRDHNADRDQAVLGVDRELEAVDHEPVELIALGVGSVPDLGAEARAVGDRALERVGVGIGRTRRRRRAEVRLQPDATLRPLERDVGLLALELPAPAARLVGVHVVADDVVLDDRLGAPEVLVEDPHHLPIGHAGPGAERRLGPDNQPLLIVPSDRHRLLLSL